MDYQKEARTKIKTYLDKVEKKRIRYERAKSNYKNTVLSAGDIKAYDYTKEKITGANISDPTERAVLKIEKARIRHDKTLTNYIDFKITVLNQIDQVNNPDYKSILYLRYIKRLKWETIATLSGRNKRNLYKLHICALDELVTVI